MNKRPPSVFGGIPGAPDGVSSFIFNQKVFAKFDVCVENNLVCVEKNLVVTALWWMLKLCVVYCPLMRKEFLHCLADTYGQFH